MGGVGIRHLLQDESLCWNGLPGQIVVPVCTWRTRVRLCHCKVSAVLHMWIECAHFGRQKSLRGMRRVGGAWCHFSRPALYVQPVSVQVPWAVLAAFCVGTGKMGMSELLGQRVFLACVWGVLLSEPCGRCLSGVHGFCQASMGSGHTDGTGCRVLHPSCRHRVQCKKGWRCMPTAVLQGYVKWSNCPCNRVFGRHWLWVSGWVTRTWCASMLAC